MEYKKNHKTRSRSLTVIPTIKNTHHNTTHMLASTSIKIKAGKLI